MALAANAPIGIFDSGVGGLTVTRAIVDQLPQEQIHYIGDTAHTPYGPRSAEEVREYSLTIADQLAAAGCKMLVIACNTATSVMLEEAQQRYDFPVVGVIEPAVRRAVQATHTGRVGVIGTQRTVASGMYQQQFAQYPGIEVAAVACPAFVDFVEKGVTSGRQILGIAQGYLAPLQAADIDTLVLGCTHYPLLAGVIQLALGQQVQLVSSSEETAKDVMRILFEQDLLRDAEVAGPPQRIFEATGDRAAFMNLAERFLGPRLGDAATHP